MCIINMINRYIKHLTEKPRYYKFCFFYGIEYHYINDPGTALADDIQNDFY